MTDQRARAKALAGGHYSCEDSWYSCPLSSDGCSDDRQEGCTCGYDNRVDKIAMALTDERRRVDEEAKRLRECLVEVNRVLQDPESTGISDTIWYNDMITLVEFIDGVLGENPDQQELPIPQAHAGQEG